MVALTLNSCARAYYDYSEWSARYIEPKHECAITPVTASLELLTKERIAHTSEIEILQGVVGVDLYKSMAMSQAVKKYSADILIAPLYEIESFDYGRKIRVLVSGYPARYINFRDVTKEDAFFFMNGNYDPSSNITDRAEPRTSAAKQTEKSHLPLF